MTNEVKTSSKNKVAVVAGIISISAFFGHTAKEIDANTKAAFKVDQVAKSMCFEKKWLESKLDLEQTNGLSKIQVLQKLKDSSTAIELEMYRDRSSTIGFTYATSKRIWMNRKFHDGYSVCKKASNLLHELFHKIGFGHDIKATKRRPFSAPYLAGSIASQCCVE